MIKGIDSRYWDGVIPPGYEDFEFVGIKISQGTKDNLDLSAPKRQWKLAPAQDLNRLPFHFWKGSTSADAEQDGIDQAEFFFDMMNKLDPGLGELPPCVDAEDKWALKGVRSLISICSCAKRTQELWGKEPLIYTASWWWNQWITPYDDFDRSKYDPYKYKLWEADPPPDTREPGDWTKDDLAIIQVVLDWNAPGFRQLNGRSVGIDIDWADEEWYMEQLSPTIPPPPGEKTVVDVGYDPNKAEIRLEERV
jgi:hypothetical protein